MLFSQATEVWHLFAAMTLLGFISGINLTSWRVLFFNHIEKHEYGQTLGIYQTAVAVAYGLAAALGGLAGDHFGFDMVLVVGGAVMFIGGFLPLTIRQFIASERLI